METAAFDTNAKRAIIFGAGRIAEALTPILACVGFRVWIFDNDPDAAKEERFPQADTVLCGDYQRLSDYLELTADDFLVVLTPRHAFDYDVQLQVLRGDCGDFGYLGVISARGKVPETKLRLRTDGIRDVQLDKIHSPIGTPIRAVSPEEIAVSIAGEMILERTIMREGAQDAHHKCPMK